MSVTAGRHVSRRTRQRWERFDARVLRDGRMVAPLPDIHHGSRSTYTNHGCRCEPCTDANRRYVQAWNADYADTHGTSYWSAHHHNARRSGS